MRRKKDAITRSSNLTPPIPHTATRTSTNLVFSGLRENRILQRRTAKRPTSSTIYHTKANVAEACGDVIERLLA